MKKCPKCKRELSLNKFYPNKASKDGFQNACKKCQNKGRREREKTPEGRFYVYKHCSQKNSRDFKLTKEEFISFWNKKCYYCGNKIETIGLDRIDNKKGYSKNNVVPCCSPCNWMKSDWSQKKFINHCKKIIKNNKI